MSGRYNERIYGIENVSSQDECVDGYIRQTRVSFNQQPNVEDFIELQAISKSWLKVSKDELSISMIIGVIMQYLPPPTAVAAQQFLQPQNNEQNQPHNDIQSED